MASDKQQFQTSYNKRQELLEAGNLSAPVGLGLAVILCSYFSDWGEGYKAEKRSRKDIKAFRKEALSIADFLGEIGIQAEVVLNATKEDFDDVLSDPDVASIYTIGHGSLSSFWIPGAYNEIYDWTDVSEAADHLKTGYFVQRHCGGLERDFNPPLGMFAVAELNNVIAPVGDGFEPKGLNHAANELLIPVFADESTSYRQIKRDLPRDSSES